MKWIIRIFLLVFVTISLNSQSRELWNLHFQIDVTDVTGFPNISGAETDGEYFFICSSLINQVAKHDLSGNLVETFSIPNLPFGLEDLTTDGEYFYSGSGSASNIFQMDFTTHTIVSNISTPMAVDGIAYDPDEDGFWITNWQSQMLMLIDRNGFILNQMVFTDGANGMTHQSDSTGNYFLWIYSGIYTGGDGIVKQYELPGLVSTGITHNVTADFPGTHSGGLFFSNEIVPGIEILGGIAKGTTSYLFGYELSNTSKAHSILQNSELSNFPNPFNPSTTIFFDIATEDTKNAKIEIYNLNGQKVKTIFPGSCYPELVEGRGNSSYNVTWKGTDQTSKPVSSGLYFYQLKVDGKVKKHKKMMLLK